MLRKLENEIVKECAPTLAGIKMANLFNYRFVSEDEFDSEIKTANMNLNEKGVYIEVLRKTDMSSLIYVYRPSMLFKAVNNDHVWNILSSYGYIERSIQACINTLLIKDRTANVVVCGRYITMNRKVSEHLQDSRNVLRYIRRSL